MAGLGLVDGHCWGHGATSSGWQNAPLQMTRCSRCAKPIIGRRKSGRRSPLWFAGPLEPEPVCVPCARARHDGCPCGFENHPEGGTDAPE